MGKVLDIRGGGVGGDLSASAPGVPYLTPGGTTISVPWASESQAAAGTNQQTLMNPLRVAQAISALAAGSSPVRQTITDGETITLAWLHASLNCVTLGGNRTLAISGTPVAGERCTLRIKQDGTGARTITWPTSGVNINWPLGEEPILTTTANRVDAIELICFDDAPGALVFDAYPLPMNVY